MLQTSMPIDRLHETGYGGHAAAPPPGFSNVYSHFMATLNTDLRELYSN